MKIKELKQAQEDLQILVSIARPYLTDCESKDRIIHSAVIMHDAAEKQIPKEPVEMVKDAMKIIKEFCEEKTSCKGCPLCDDSVDGCKLDSIPAEWDSD